MKASITLFEKLINQRKKHSSHFGDDDIIIDDFRLSSVHNPPLEQWSENQEVDFYMDDTVNIYLLRIVNNKDNTITLIDDEHNDIRYIIVHINVDNTLDALRRITQRLKEIPYSNKISGEKQYYFFE